MKLLTQEIKARFAQLGEQDKPDAIVVAKFFCPWNQWTWYATAMVEEEGQVLFFGLVHGMETELGYFALSDLESARGPAGLRIERDLHWKERPLDEVRRLVEVGVRP